MTFPKFLKIAVQPNDIENKTNGKAFSVMDVKQTEVLATALKFSYQLVTPADGEYGRRLQNGSWTGMLGMLQKGDADMIVSLIGLTEERSGEFLFSSPHFNDEVTYITRKPESSTKMQVFMNPFSIEVWFSIAIYICIMPFVLQCLMPKKYSLVSHFLSTISALVQQGIESEAIRPKKPQGYFALALWLLGSALLSHFYAQVLLSFIAFPSLQGIWTIEDLANGIKEGRYQAVTIPGSALESILLDSNDPSFKIIGESLQLNKGTFNAYAAIESSASKEITAYIDGRTFLDTYKDLYFLSEDTFFRLQFAFAARKDFCCKSELDVVVGRIWGAGLIEKIIIDDIFKQFLKGKSKYEKPNSMIGDNNQTANKLTMAVFQGPFLFLIVSHTFSFIVLLIELCVGKLKCKKKTNRIGEGKRCHAAKVSTNISQGPGKVISKSNK